MKTIRFLLLAVFWLGARSALAAPARVIIIRHAEKPDEGSELSERGWQRSRALVGFFENDRSLAPAAIYAMAPKGPDGSVRAIQTVQPLAGSLHVEINKSYKRKEVAALTAEIMAGPRQNVLVCWEHAVIPDVVKAFGWDSGPDDWPKDVYDRVWVLDFKDEKPVAFRDLPQRLLPGDSAD